ncbi:MAG: hypothetical protein Q8S73_38535, partial [Deltaproteobacteria bacterium]|nr:hypothetical protein [Deltaproteobacteria bacterium]
MCPDDATARDDGRESLPMCCLSTIRLVQERRVPLVCHCGETYLFDRASALPPAPRGLRRSPVPARLSSPDPLAHRVTLPAPPPEPVSIDDAGRAIANLLRWLPDLSPRSGPLVRDGVRVETPATALDGRPDRLDERSRQVNAAVRAWQRLRAMVAAGEGRHAAVLWAAHAGVVELHDAEGRRIGGPAQRARQVTAVALGCASRTQRDAWREAAAERPTVVGYMSRIEPAAVAPIPTAGTPSVRHELAAGVQDRERWVRHLEQRGAEGPSVDAQAAAWGAERMADLWAPGAAPAAV